MESGLDTYSIAPGQIIETRSRLWRVDSVKGKLIEATPIDGLFQERQKFFTPVENIKSGGLPYPSTSEVGNLAEQKLLLRSLKLDLLHSTAPILSLQRSRVIPEEFQLVPLIMAMEMPRVRMLIADDVGLGKTVEAGLITKELIGRNMARKILVVCPANLRNQWKEALNYFFHLDARIISSRHIRAMEKELPPGADPWEHYDLLVTSIDYVKKDPTRQRVFEQNWDAVIIDEAHNCAKPHQTQEGQRVDMKRWEFARDISKKCTHLLLLTATPHNGYSDSYASLLNHLDVDLVSGPIHDPRINKERAKSFVCQRRRSDVLDWFKREEKESPFPDRDQKEEMIPPSNPQRKVIEKIRGFTQHISEVAEEEEKKFRKLMAAWTIIHFHRRALSSPHSLVKSLKNRIKKVNAKIGEIEAGEVASNLTLDQAKAVALDEDPGERVTDEEAGERLEREVFGHKKALEKELELLQEALESAKRVTPSRDEKLKRMKSMVYERLRIKPKLIIFTRYLDTLEYLEKQLKSDKLFQNTEILTLYGEMSDGQRKETFFEFEDARKAVLIATDCLSEGIDLQYMASQIVHYELPWNPNRLEQRNGRVDRYGQKADTVYIRSLVMEDRLDAAILKTLVKKAERIRSDYGFSPPFFGDNLTVLDLIREEGMDISFAMQTSLMEFGEEGLRGREQINPFSDEKIEKIREESFYGQTKIEFEDVRRRLEDTKKLVGSQEEIEGFVISGLKRFGAVVEEVDDGVFDFMFPESSFLGRSFGERIERATFDPYRAAKNPRLNLIDLGHPLVRELIEELKAEAFRDGERYGRTAHMSSEDLNEVTAVYHILVRYSVKAKQMPIMEEIIPVAIKVYSGEALDEGETERLLRASPSRTVRSSAEVRETLERALGDNITAIFNEKAEERRKQLIMERRRFKQRIEEKGLREWVKGIDNISVASIDLLTVTIYYPEVGGI